MGDRVSVRFANGDRIGVTLFSHWRGMSFVDLARWYAVDLCIELLRDSDGMCWPLDRLEPNYVMVDFIRWLCEAGEIGDRNRNDIYLGQDTRDGDDTDNGHFIIDLGWVMKMVRLESEFGDASMLRTTLFAPPQLTPGPSPGGRRRSGSSPRPRRG